MSPLIDTDVHVRWGSNDEILPYLSKTWHSRWLLGRGGHTASGLYIQPKYYDPDDPAPMPDGRGGGLTTVNLAAVASPLDLAVDWLDRHSIAAAVVSCYDSPLISTYGDTDYPVEVARVVNRWLTDRFLAADSRIFGSITIATQEINEAVKEIYRAAEHPRMVQILLPAGARMPYGHRYYRPIFKAAQECGLSIAIPSGTEGLGTSNMPTPSGWPGTVAEMRVARVAASIAHMTSLVTEGVFTECPDVHIISFETGVAWLPPYLWRFDKNWKALRSECPWLKELPSEIVARHFRFGSANVTPVEPAEEFWRLMNSIPDARFLLHASNYPRWDYEEPEDSFVMRTASESLQPWLRSEGALAAYPRLKGCL